MTDIYDQTIVRHQLHVTPEPDAIEQVRRRLGWRLFVTNCPAEMLSLGDAVYASRALTAQVGWGGNDAIEAFYLMARVDANGKNLDGAHAYQLRWENDPPVNAFWSLTMYDKSYDGAAGYLVKNPINHYLINSTTEGLVRDADGGLTITIQHVQYNMRNQTIQPKEQTGFPHLPRSSTSLCACIGQNQQLLMAHGNRR